MSIESQIDRINEEVTIQTDLIEQAKNTLNGKARTTSVYTDGATFVPSVSDDGVISWTNDKGLVNPTPVNIKGPKGDSVTITSVECSSEDGGANTVTFSDSSILIVNNGDTGSRGFGIFSTTDNMTLNPDGEFYEVLEGAIDVPYEYGGLMEGDFVFSTYTKNLYKIDHIVPPYCMLIKVADLTGETGAVGPAGEDGKDGKTPVKYVDYYTDADKAEFSEYIASELAKRGQLEPEYANSIDECTDTSKMYVLPDGFIYAYVMKVTEGGAGYTNLVPTSIDTNGSVYNGTGYKDNVRLSSSGGVSSTAQNGSVTTGFMPWQSNGVIRIKGATWESIAGQHYYIHLYDANKSRLADGDISADTIHSGIGWYAKIIVTYDETSGVTTVDMSTTTIPSATGDALRNAKYFRLNAKGKGADLIVTVNEEIKEATSTVTYEWTNTGRAFVPADYEDRIVEVENKASLNAARVGQLEGQMQDILDGETEIAAATKFDPTVYGLPVLYLTGDISPIIVNKDNKVTVSYVYEGRSGSCTLKGQGATSYAIAQKFGDKGKYNYTINFDNAFEAVDGWGSQKKYCLKANWNDPTHSRNIVSARLWGLMSQSRANVPAQLSVLPNFGAVDGFPVVIMLNGEFHGLYTFNIPKDPWLFGMGSGVREAIISADDSTHNDTAFKGETTLNGDSMELEYAPDEDDTEWIKESMNTLINACINSDGSDLDTVVSRYLDWDAAVDYYILTVLLESAADMVNKNWLIITLDGTKWYFSPYDMDATYGLKWDATGTKRPVSGTTFVDCASDNRVFELIKLYKTNALKARYNALRANALSESRICQYFENFAWAIPSVVYMEDVKRWPAMTHGSAVLTIDQICRWVRQRLEATDKWIEEL